MNAITRKSPTIKERIALRAANQREKLNKLLTDTKQDPSAEYEEHCLKVTELMEELESFVYTNGTEIKLLRMAVEYFVQSSIQGKEHSADVVRALGKIEQLIASIGRHASTIEELKDDNRKNADEVFELITS